MKLKWQQAPVKTQWGDEMVVASVAIDKDHTVSLYCERDQTPNVEAMLAQRTWVGLNQTAIVEAFCSTPHKVQYVSVFESGARWAEANLKELNQ